MFDTKFELFSFQNLKLLITLLWITIVGHFMASQWLNPLTPAQIEATAINYSTHAYSMIAGAAGLVFLFIASLDLFKQNERGRKLFLLSILFILIYDLLLGPQIKSIWLERFDSTGNYLLGIIVALIWSKPVNALFSGNVFNLATPNNMRIICSSLLALSYFASIFFLLGDKTWLISNYALLINMKVLSYFLVAIVVFFGILAAFLISNTFITAIVSFIFRYNIAKYLLPLFVIHRLLSISKPVVIYGWPYFFSNVFSILTSVLLTLVFIKAFDKEFIATLTTNNVPVSGNSIITPQLSARNNIPISENGINATQMSSQIKEKELCTIGGISLAALVGGPLGAFYLISRNYMVLNKKFEAILNLCYGLFFTFFTFSVITLLYNNTFNYVPAMSVGHNFILSKGYYIIPIAFASLIGRIASTLQATNIKNELQSGIKKYSILKIIGVALVSLVVSIVLVDFLNQILKSAFIGHYLNLAHQLWLALQAIYQHRQN